MTEPGEITGYWLGLPAKKYFTKDAGFDAELRDRFSAHVEQAIKGDLDDWRSSAEGALALILLLDQFTRNIYRDTPDMFAGDGKALDVTRTAIDRGFDRSFPVEHRSWFYMPFMHSEDLSDQEQCIALCEASGLDKTLPYAVQHADIIRRFGRFPHRNSILGRTSSPEEIAFLESGGFSG